MDTLDHRASDAEREATADRLRVAAGDGRLDPEELEQRLDAAYSAKTVGDLGALTRDLPAHAPAAAPPERRWDSQAVRARLASFIVVNTICIVIWAASGANGGFWPIWVILGTGIGLFAAIVRRALGVEEEEHRHRRGHGRRRLEPPRHD
jgi:Domain of unknown function (DUF1707)